MQNCRATLEFLESEEMSASPEEISHFKSVCHEIFPYAIAFMPPQQTSTTTTTTTTTPDPNNSINSVANTNHHNHVDATVLS